MTLHKLHVVCKPDDIQKLQDAYAKDNSQENFNLLVEAYVNAERIEDVKKGMTFIGQVLEEDSQRKDLLFLLACGQVRCEDYVGAVATVKACLEIDQEFWKAKALEDIITNASSFHGRRKSQMKQMGYGALTAVAAAAGGIALLWSSPKMKTLRTKTFPEWKDASDLVDKLENKMIENMLVGACVGAVSVGIMVVGYFTVLAKHISD